MYACASPVPVAEGIPKSAEHGEVYHTSECQSPSSPPVSPLRSRDCDTHSTSDARCGVGFPNTYMFYYSHIL